MFFKKRHVVAGSDSCGQSVWYKACDGFGFADAFRFEAVFDGHVLEVCVSAEVKLVSFVHDDSAVKAESYEVAVKYGCADLAFDVVAKHW